MNEFEAVNEMIDEDLSPVVSLAISTQNRATIYPMIYGTRRDGTTFMRNSPLKPRGRIDTVKSFEEQDMLKNAYRAAEVSGGNPHFCIILMDGGYIKTSKMFSDWYMQNSEIAEMYRHGWRVIVE